MAPLDMPVKAVVAHVGLAAFEKVHANAALLEVKIPAHMVLGELHKKTTFNGLDRVAPSSSILIAMISNPM